MTTRRRLKVRRIRFSERGHRGDHHDKHLLLHYGPGAAHAMTAYDYDQQSSQDAEGSTSHRKASLMPPGWTSGKFESDDMGGTRREDRAAILMRQAWSTAQSPARQIFMTGFM